MRIGRGSDTRCYSRSREYSVLVRTDTSFITGEEPNAATAYSFYFPARCPHSNRLLLFTGFSLTHSLTHDNVIESIGRLIDPFTSKELRIGLFGHGLRSTVWPDRSSSSRGLGRRRLHEFMLLGDVRSLTR